MATKSYAELTVSEKKAVIEQRSKGKSIKAIAKEMHISDKRISAFLRPIEEKERKHRINKGLFDKFIRLTCRSANESVNEFVAELSNSQLTQIEGVLSEQSAKKRKEKLHTALTGVLETFIAAALRMGIVAMWTMPAKYKKLWMYNIFEDPPKCKAAKHKGK